MFILWWSVSLIKQTNKQKSVTKFSLFHATEKSHPEFETAKKAAFQTIQKWGNGFAISFLWSKQRIEAGKRESQKSVLFIPSPLAAFCSFQPQECRGWCSAAGMYRSTCKPIVLNETWIPVRTRALLLVMLFIKTTKRDGGEVWNVT